MTITQKLAVLSAAADILTNAGYSSDDGRIFVKPVAESSPQPRSETLQVTVDVTGDVITTSLAYAKVGISGDVVTSRRVLDNTWDGKDFTLATLSGLERICTGLGSDIV